MAGLSEAQLQSQCVIWMRNEKPETRGLFFAITNNSENIGRAMQRKSMGLIPGVADTCFLWRGEAYFIEFKTPEGNQSPEQKQWQKTIEKHGIEYYIVRSFEQFKNLIENVQKKS
jgi:hypothetical protein